MTKIALSVNGSPHEADVEPRQLLAYFLRDGLGLTGTNVGCDTSSCGACTVLLEGESVKSCTVLAVQADGSAVTTIEGIAAGDELHPVQQAFHELHALQCGYCTPGFVMATISLLEENPKPSEEEIRLGLEGNLGFGRQRDKEICAAADYVLSAGERRVILVAKRDVLITHDDDSESTDLLLQGCSLR